MEIQNLKDAIAASSKLENTVLENVNFVSATNRPHEWK